MKMMSTVLGTYQTYLTLRRQTRGCESTVLMVSEAKLKDPEV
jgi:hypothetical protein